MNPFQCEKTASTGITFDASNVLHVIQEECQAYVFVLNMDLVGSVYVCNVYLTVFESRNWDVIYCEISMRCA